MWCVSDGCEDFETEVREGERERGGVLGGMIKFVLFCNKLGQTRLSRYYEEVALGQREALEGEIVRTCLRRTDAHCNLFEHRGYKVIYKRYASLFFIVGVDGEENELAVLELIHLIVETLDKYFENVCELDMMFFFDRVHFIVDEMIVNGFLVDANKANALAPLRLLDMDARG